MSRPGRWPNCAYRRTNCGKKMSACEPSWKPAGPNDRESLLAPFLLPVQARAKRQLYWMISTSRQMMSYHPAVLPARAVHHPRTPWKPTQEKGRPAGPAYPSVFQGIGHGGNPSKTNNRPCPLNNMWPTQPGASQGQFHPYTHLSEPASLLKWYLHPPSGDHRINSPPPPPPPPPRGFSIPPFAMYDGSSDPYDHMLHYNQAMILSAGDDRLLCKVFPASLKGPSLAWFYKLPSGSINTISELWAVFVSQYLCSIIQKGNISSLQSILKREE